MNEKVPMGIRETGEGHLPLIVGLTVASLTLVGCGGTYESATRDDLASTAVVLSQGRVDEGDAVPLDGSLASYVAHALAHSPALRASFERWKASTMRIARARRMPEPVVKYSYFIRSIETRVGPQQHKLSLMQAFPWPTALSAGADAASARAELSRSAASL